jgi:DNA invertase Pin-like site-specific DNA recombinase
MIVAYTRTSTLDQVAGFEAQSKELSAAGCEKIFREQVSSATVRLQLQSALKFVRNGEDYPLKTDRTSSSLFPTRLASPLVRQMRMLLSPRRNSWNVFKNCVSLYNPLHS